MKFGKKYKDTSVKDRRATVDTSLGNKVVYCVPFIFSLTGFLVPISSASKYKFVCVT
jgi:hypothetical protein